MRTPKRDYLTGRFVSSYNHSRKRRRRKRKKANVAGRPKRRRRGRGTMLRTYKRPVYGGRGLFSILRKGIKKGLQFAPEILDYASKLNLPVLKNAKVKKILQSDLAKQAAILAKKGSSRL